MLIYVAKECFARGHLFQDVILNYYEGLGKESGILLDLKGIRVTLRVYVCARTHTGKQICFCFMKAMERT